MDNNTYINILGDTLKRKNALLDQIIKMTLLQERCITNTPQDLEQLDQYMNDKGILIERLNSLDDGFEHIYDHIKEELSNNRMKYKEEIICLQELIREVTDKSAQLQAIEIRNKNKMELYFSGRKKEIKDFKMSSKTVSNYYKNMADGYQGESLFLDKKK